MAIRQRLKWALLAYALIAVAAWFTLDGAFRWVVLIILGAFAAKSWIAARREELE